MYSHNIEQILSIINKTTLTTCYRNKLLFVYHILQKIMQNIENLQSLIDSGEGYNVELKVRFPSKVRKQTEEICAFANANGGYLLIGVDDNGQIARARLKNNKIAVHNCLMNGNFSLIL